MARRKIARPRTYRLERNAEKRAKDLRAQWPERSFFVTVNNAFRFVVATREPNDKIAFCS